MLRIRFPLILEYDASALADGLGAQSIRLIGIYSIAYKYRLYYQHKPIEFIPKEELIGFPYDDSKYLKVMNEVHRLTYLPNIGSPSKSTKIFTIRRRSITRRILLKIILFAFFRRCFKAQNTKLLLCLPQGISDSVPDLLEIGAREMRKNFSSPDRNLWEDRVVIHFRGGLRVVDALRPQLHHSYYDDALIQNNIRKECESIIVHTDFFLTDFSKSTLGVRVKMFSDWIEHKWSSVEGVKILHYAPILEVLKDMVSCKLLIMSNSSLSYFAGLLNPNVVVWPQIHGHSKISRWIMGPLISTTHVFIDKNHVPYLNWNDPRDA